MSTLLTDGQFRGWLRIKLGNFLPRLDFMSGSRKRFTPLELVENLEAIAKEARGRLKDIR